MKNLFADMINYVAMSLYHNSIFLLLGILIAVVMKVYIDPEKVRQALLRKTKTSILSSVAFGAFTPLCACGTMAVIIAMLSTTLPWGPIMAFLTSSPLMSPDGFVLIAGIISLKFAIALAAASVVIGLGSGYITHLIENRTDFLKDQIRFSKKVDDKSCGCSSTINKPAAQTCGCSVYDSYGSETYFVNQMCCEVSIDRYSSRFPVYLTNGLEPIKNISAKVLDFLKMIKWSELEKNFVDIGVKQILLYYSILVAIGFLINRFIPASIIVTFFSDRNIFAVPIAAVVGLPVYVNGESAIPLIKSLMEAGASGGAMLAFLITGPGTSAGVIAGIATIMKRRAIILYILLLLVGGICLGYFYNLLLAMGV